MNRYADAFTLKQGLQEYFKVSGFDDSSYTINYVKLKIGPIPLYMPNPQSRKLAVKTHDLHHVLTEYKTDWAGETQIGAWEVGSGCRKVWIAWFLNMSILPVGIVLNPKKSILAFVAGRRSRNLYDLEYDDVLLSKTIGQVRNELKIQTTAQDITSVDFANYVIWFLLSLIAFFLNVVLIFGPPILVIWLIIRAFS